MIIAKEQVPVVTSVKRRHKGSLGKKRSIVQEYAPGMFLSLVARKYVINPILLYMEKA